LLSAFTYFSISSHSTASRTRWHHFSLHNILWIDCMGVWFCLKYLKLQFYKGPCLCRSCICTQYLCFGDPQVLWLHTFCPRQFQLYNPCLEEILYLTISLCKFVCNWLIWKISIKKNRGHCYIMCRVIAILWVIAILCVDCLNNFINMTC